MTGASAPLPAACTCALEAVVADPLSPGPAAEAHLRTCRPCAEARVALLAQEEATGVVLPEGYLERLPGRILGKLPVRVPLHRRFHPMLWAAAAALVMGVGAGAFWAGRANRTPLVEASLPAAESQEASEGDIPFHDREEDAAQVHALSPEEMQALLKRLDAPRSR